jgi:hypothetical protein
VFMVVIDPERGSVVISTRLSGGMLNSWELEPL